MRDPSSMSYTASMNPIMALPIDTRSFELSNGRSGPKVATVQSPYTYKGSGWHEGAGTVHTVAHLLE